MSDPEAQLQLPLDSAFTGEMNIGMLTPAEMDAVRAEAKAAFRRLGSHTTLQLEEDRPG